MTTLKVTADGQVTIPQEILEPLDLKPGDQIDCQVEADGKIVLRSHNDGEADDEVLVRLRGLKDRLDKGEKLDIRDLIGVLHRKGMRTVSLEEMNESVKQHVAREVMSELE